MVTSGRLMNSPRARTYTRIYMERKGGRARSRSLNALRVWPPLPPPAHRPPPPAVPLLQHPPPYSPPAVQTREVADQAPEALGGPGASHLIIRHFKSCTTEIYLQNECAHVGLSVQEPVTMVLERERDLRAAAREGFNKAECELDVQQRH